MAWGERKLKQWTVQWKWGHRPVEAHYFTFENGGVVSFWKYENDYEPAKMVAAFSPEAWMEMWED